MVEEDMASSEDGLEFLSTCVTISFSLRTRLFLSAMVHWESLSRVGMNVAKVRGREETGHLQSYNLLKAENNRSTLSMSAGLGRNSGFGEMRSS